jgi:1-phosphofructokinase
MNDTRISVFASSLVLTITVEASSHAGGDEIHLHPGGQGYWVARMVGRLGENCVLSTCLGGEAGLVLAALVASDTLMLAPTWQQAESPVYIHDRRSGQRVPVAERPHRKPTRHEQDDFYSRTLETAIEAGSCVVTGRYLGGGLPATFLTRLAADLAATGVTAIGDLHGRDLDAFLKGGPLDLLKVSADDLKSDGVLTSDHESEVKKAITRILRRGVTGVVVSGAGQMSLASIDGAWYRVHQPTLEAADHRGSGDSMTAGLTVARVRGEDAGKMLRLGAAAGAANVVRRGLGNADRDLIEALQSQVEVEEVASP